MTDKLREYATDDLGFKTRKLEYFKKQYEESKADELLINRIGVALSLLIIR